MAGSPGIMLYSSFVSFFATVLSILTFYYHAIHLEPLRDMLLFTPKSCGGDAQLGIPFINVGHLLHSCHESRILKDAVILIDLF